MIAPALAPATPRPASMQAAADARPSAREWRELLALYERADGLDDRDRDAWLAEIAGRQSRLMPMLDRLFQVRSELESRRFLGTLPALPGSRRRRPRCTDERVGPWRLKRRLGAGGAAEVWLADAAARGGRRDVALKLPFDRCEGPEQAGFAARFEHEREILASIRHPNVAALIDAGITAGGQRWLAIEHVDGEPIDAWCDRRRAPLDQRLGLFGQVLDAVEHCHARRVLHRDLKPANILVTGDGRAKLVDFGIARMLEAGDSPSVASELTRRDGRPLTPQYASPEQVGGAPLTPASDVYSLGLVLHELLTGNRPYDTTDASLAQIVHLVLHAQPPAPSRSGISTAAAKARRTTRAALVRRLQAGLDDIVQRALGKQAAARYPSARALREAIERCVSRDERGDLAAAPAGPRMRGRAAVRPAFC